MGKIKKIKEERKKAKIESEMKRKKNINNSFKYAFIFFVFMLVSFGGYVAYKELDSRYQLADRFIKKESKESEELVERKSYNEAPEMQIDVNKEYIANFETNKGNFKIRLFAAEAPKTVNNFVFLSREEFYNGLTFHRIIKDFMIQGGDPSGDGTSGPGYQFEDEINDKKLIRGVLAMANSGPDTNGSQFFIVTAEATDWLDGKHTAFGEVIEGLDIVMKIEKTETGENDKPVIPVIINKIEILEK